MTVAHYVLDRTEDAAAPAFCPRCRSTAFTMNLLTSMTRYFSCDRCARSWQVPRFRPSDRSS